MRNLTHVTRSEHFLLVTRALIKWNKEVLSYFSMAAQKKGLVLGLYEGEPEGQFSLTTSATQYASKAARLNDLITLSGLANKKGKSRVFYGVDDTYAGVAVVSAGKQGQGYNALEEVEEGRENVRIAVATGVRQLQEAGFKDADVDPLGDAEAASEGAYLSMYNYDELKAKDKQKEPLNLTPFTEAAGDANAVKAEWERGRILAEGQNMARKLMEMPASHLTPTKFGEIATEKLGSLPNTTVIVRDKAWAQEKGMNSFLSVAQGSPSNPPKFVEVHYQGGNEGDAPFALVGKGITFDSGGISIKPSQGMDAMRADMGGAACVLSSIYTVARLKIPINVKGFMALTDNMPSGSATHPGDVVTAMNGKTIQVDNTDAEGRLVLADALCYAQTFNPSGILDMATLTGAMMVALGASATGVFTNSTRLWEVLHKAGTVTGDRMWRMPLWDIFTKQMTDSQLADLNNIGTGGRAGGACTAAAFLKEFVTNDNYMHLDIAGVMENKKEVPYLNAGMAGRPTRTIVEFLNRLSKS